MNACYIFPSSHLPFKPLVSCTKSIASFILSIRTPRFLCNLSPTMHSLSNSNPPRTYRVPDLNPIEIGIASEDAFARYSSDNTKRSGSGISIVWFRNDLRLLDNEVIYRAWSSSEAIVPVYVIDPRNFGGTHYFGFPKTGSLRAQFLIECLDDLKRNLIKRGSNLLIQLGKPEEILPSIAKALGAHTVYAQKETCSEEVGIETLVSKALQHVLLSQGKPGVSSKFTKLQLIWGSTMYNIKDLPFDSANLPDIYTQFRKAVESRSSVRSCFKLPILLGPVPSSGIDAIGGWGDIPSLEQLGIQEKKQSSDKGMIFVGGESAALARVKEYFWDKDLIRIYKEIRNGMLGSEYSTKFSPWLASGSLSPRYVYEEVKRYEKERHANDSTYWVLFELIWRDYFRFLSIKCGNSLFHLGGPRKLVTMWSQDKTLFECWRDGCTGYPLIDANMKELSTTGFMSNRGRQIVCSFLVRDMGIDWRMGAEWFESCLLDYDPCSNYGNWTYGAGVGTDPREDRYFSIPKQAQTYDPEGEYVAYWLPELINLPKEKRNFPKDSYTRQVVPLKFGSTHQSPGYPNNSKSSKQKRSYRR